MAARPGATVPVVGELGEARLSSLPGAPSPRVTGGSVSQPALTPKPEPWGGKLGGEAPRPLTRAPFSVRACLTGESLQWLRH